MDRESCENDRHIGTHRHTIDVVDSTSKHPHLVLLTSPFGPVALTVDTFQMARLKADAILGNSISANRGVTKDDLEPLLDAGRIAGLFGMDATWFLTRAREDRIPHVRFGKFVRFDPLEIRDFFHRNPDRHANYEETPLIQLPD